MKLYSTVTVDTSSTAFSPRGAACAALGPYHSQLRSGKAAVAVLCAGPAVEPDDPNSCSFLWRGVQPNGKGSMLQEVTEQCGSRRDETRLWEKTFTELAVLQQVLGQV
jgi:hypothetical protein